MGTTSGFVHALGVTRNWDNALDALHHLLLKKWYYLGIASNTKKGASGNLLTDSLDFSRKRSDTEGKAILGLGRNSFSELMALVNQQKWGAGGEADVWHLKSGWKELPSGTCLIELNQNFLFSALTGSKENKRTAFVVLDGKAAVQDQTNSLLLVKKVFTDKGYTQEQLKEARSSKANEPKLVQAAAKKPGRQPGGLVMALQEDFEGVVKTLTLGERNSLETYFNQLEARKEANANHRQLQEKVSSYWLHKLN